MSCWNDFSKLQEVVVGRAEHKPVHLHDEPATRKKLDAAGVGKASWRQEMLAANKSLVLDSGADRHKKCVEQVAEFIQVLKDNDVAVLRPDIVPGWEKPASTPWYSVHHHYGTPCPRDLFIKFGDLIVETYSGWRCRYFEGESYYSCIEQHCEKYDCRSIKMPRGILSEELYPGYCSASTSGCGGDGAQFKTAFTEHCAIIEAADIRRFGRDVFMQTGGYSNEKGFNWLKRLLKHEDINLHKMTFADGATSYYHLDAKFTAVTEDTILYAGDHKPSQEIFDMFEKKGGFRLLEAPKREVLVSPEDFTCSGLNLNMLVLEPGKVVVEKYEKGTIKYLREECACDVIPVDFSNAFEFGGAFNCWTFDTVREGGNKKHFG